MKRLTHLSGVALALALAACAAEPEPTLTVSDVRVDADLSAVASRDAAAYWGNLPADLSSAIAQEFVGQTAPNGWVVAVDIDEISLANVLTRSAGPDDARLTGEVALLEPGSDDPERTYTVSASANQAATFLPAGTDVIALSPTSQEYYAAVVQAFARGVAETVRAGG